MWRAFSAYDCGRLSKLDNHLLRFSHLRDEGLSPGGYALRSGQSMSRMAVLGVASAIWVQPLIFHQFSVTGKELPTGLVYEDPQHFYRNVHVIDRIKGSSIGGNSPQRKGRSMARISKPPITWTCEHYFVPSNARLRLEDALGACMHALTSPFVVGAILIAVCPFFQIYKCGALHVEQIGRPAVLA